MHCRGSPAGRSVVIGLDTNVHVRHLAQDDPKQSVVATRFIEALTSASLGFVSHIATYGWSSDPSLDALLWG